MADTTPGVAGLVVGQPFDVVKVRYQTPEYRGRYSSIRSAFGELLAGSRLIRSCSKVTILTAQEV